jgi:Family of unknown function (DUF6504)
MRRYTDPVEVRQGPLEDDARGLGAQGAAEGPQQFLWRGRLWKVRAVLAHWVETGPWWQSTGARAVVGSEEAAAETHASGDRGRVPLGDLLTERELWRVEAGRPRPPAITPDGDTESGISGVFDLSFDWADGRWTLVGCTD